MRRPHRFPPLDRPCAHGCARSTVSGGEWPAHEGFVADCSSSDDPYDRVSDSDKSINSSGWQNQIDISDYAWLDKGEKGNVTGLTIKWVSLFTAGVAAVVLSIFEGIIGIPVAISRALGKLIKNIAAQFSALLAAFLPNWDGVFIPAVSGFFASLGGSGLVGFSFGIVLGGATLYAFGYAMRRLFDFFTGGGV